MSNKTQLILFILLLVVVGIIFLPAVQDRLSLKAQPDSIKLLQELDLAQVTQITITQGDDRRQLAKSAQNQWNINNFPADQALVDIFLTNLKETQMESIASQDPSKSELFGVTTISGYRLDIALGNQQLTYYIGNSGSTLNTVYLKPESESVIYLVNSVIRESIVGGVNSWRDKTIKQFDTDQIARIEIASPTEPLIIVRSPDDTWTAEGKNTKVTLDSTQKDALKKNLQPLTASGFMDADQVAAFAQLPKSTITIKNLSSETVAILTLAFTDNIWQAKIDNNETGFTIATPVVESIAIPYATLFK